MERQMTMKVLALAASAAVLLTATSFGADRIVLENGNVLTGKILRETEEEVVLLLDEGMRMAIERPMIREVIRGPEAVPRPEPDETPEPEKQPASDPEPEADPGPEAPETVPEGPVKLPRTGLDPSLFLESPPVSWEHGYSRYPTLTGAKVTLFRAYEYVGHSVAVAALDDPETRSMVMTHGHGGSLISWRFRYVGVREFRYGDQIRFLAEITSPREEDRLLVHLDGGPVLVAPRLQVILIRREYSVWRYVTNSVFTIRDFRREALEKSLAGTLPVRTYDSAFRQVATTWLPASDAGFLDDLLSSGRSTLLADLERYRFRLGWYATEPEARPALDPDLLGRDHPTPLAAPGRPSATEEMVRAMWGTPDAIRSRLDRLCDSLLARLSKISVAPGSDFYVERDRLGDFGPLGITLRTRRYHIAKRALDSLLRR